jgi:hypothetical protein
MKKFFRFLLPVVLVLFMGSCAGAPKPESARIPAPSETGGESLPEITGLDAALDKGAAYIAGNIPPDKTRIAVLAIDAETHELSEYIVMELRQYFQRDHKLRNIERQYLGRLIDAWDFDNGAGVVDEDLAVGMGHAEGAEIIVFGKIAAQGKEYRLTLTATDVRGGVSFDYLEPVRLPESLIPPPADVHNLDRAIDRAVYLLGRDIPGKINIAMGRISLYGYPSVTEFSRYLNDRITESALRRNAKYRVDARKTEVTAATLEGYYSTLEGGVEVSLQLVSTLRAGTIMGSSRFTVSDQEIKRRNLALLPVQGDAQVSRENFERQQRVIEPYSGEDNLFRLTAEPDHANGIYHDGERMNFTVQSERDCYIRISYVDVYGIPQTLFPAAVQDLRYNLVRAGVPWTVPDYLNLTVGLPAGEEYILIAAFETQFELEDSQASPAQSATSRPISETFINQSMRAKALITNRTEGGQLSQQADSLARTRFCYQIARPLSGGK